jgi:hypothetical protein
MSKRSQEKRKAQRKEKAAALRRRQALGLAGNLASVETCQCYISGTREEGGLESLHVFRNTRDGLVAGAFFLIDYDCLGLKDAFVRQDVSPVDILARTKEQMQYSGGVVRRVPLQEVQKRVVAAMTWTRSHGFRLPGPYAKVLRVIELDEARRATLGAEGVPEFGTTEGKLHYIGKRRDLERALITESVEEFIARPGVQFTFDVGGEAMADEWDDGEVEDMEEEWEESEGTAEEIAMVGRMVEILMTEALDVYREAGLEPPANLRGAMALEVGAVMAALANSKAAKPNLADLTAEDIDRARERLLNMIDDEQADEVWETNCEIDALRKQQGRDRVTTSAPMLSEAAAKNGEMPRQE